MMGAWANKKAPYVPTYKTPKYEPSTYPTPKYYAEEPPMCAKNSTKPWCLYDAEYPAHEVQMALDQHYQAVQALYKDVVANTANSVDYLNKLEEETYLCPSATYYAQPLRAMNIEGKWKIIVNKIESYGYKYTQTARVEECQTAIESPCPLVPSCYESKCVQKNVFHRFLVYDAYDQYFPFSIESFKLPASCGCVVGAFFP